MLHIFIDESGDLGFTTKSSKSYIIASVGTRDLVELNRIPKKVRRTLRKKRKDISEFKFTRSDDVVRRRFIERLVRANVSFSAIVLKKEMVYDYLRDRKEKIHNYLTGFLAESLTHDYSDEKEIRIVVDKFIMSEERRDEFDRYLRWRLSNYSSRFLNIEIIHEDSQQHPGLQAADFVAGSIFQYYERGNDQFYKIIEPKIRFELRRWF